MWLCCVQLACMQNAAAPALGVSEVLVVVQAVGCLAAAADLHSSQASSEGSCRSEAGGHAHLQLAGHPAAAHLHEAAPRSSAESHSSWKPIRRSSLAVCSPAEVRLYGAAQNAGTLTALPTERE